jgi:hypothetical protein
VSLGIGIAFIPSLFNLNHIEGIVVKNVVNDDNSPFDEVEINHSIAFKNGNNSRLINAILAL